MKPRPRKWGRMQNPVLVAMENAAVISNARNAEWSVPEVSAINALAQGRGDKRAWNAVARMVNTAEVMAKAGIGIEVIPVAAESQVVLAQIVERYNKTGEVSLPTSEAFVLREAQEYHNLQRTAVSYGQYKAFVKKVDDTVKSGGAFSSQSILEMANDRIAV